MKVAKGSLKAYCMAGPGMLELVYVKTKLEGRSTSKNCWLVNVEGG